MKKYLSLALALFCIGVFTILFCRAFEYSLFSMMGMNMLMGSWFLIFGTVKLLNVPGFVKSFQRYDIVTQAIPAYGYVYPLIEFVLGVAYILDHMMMYWIPINGIALVLSGLTTWGIIRSLSRHEKIHCACLGAHTQLTLGWVTLVESGSMVIMALGMILWML